ncbi:MAG: TRAP transporter small permease [Desulfocapsaceae bacterium]|jgi:C4-dicarboxylate transporter DctQ subunit|nr:TRAP transporter small permease [Desulfocapsaceae bacterium]
MAAYWPHIYLLIFILVIVALEKLFPKFMASAEENVLVLIIASIMLVSFGQVIARYGFNTGWAAALEFNTVAFSWLILLGMSYGIKIGLHLGVDILLNAVPDKLSKMLSLFGAAAAMAYGLLLLDSIWLASLVDLTNLDIPIKGGAIEYWSKMYKVGIGSEELRYPLFMQEMFDLQPRIHRWIVLLVLPVSLAMLSLRSLQAFIQIYQGKRKMLISAHEAQELVAENKDILKD